MIKKVSIDQVKAEFVRWNKSRRGVRSRVPDQLQQLTLSLRGEYTDEDIVKSLGIHRCYIRRWKKKQAKILKCKPAANQKSKARALKTKQQPEFVEIAQPLAGVAPSAGITLEWQRVDGALLKISGAFNSSQIEHFSDRFLGSAAPGNAP